VVRLTAFCSIDSASFPLSLKFRCLEDEGARASLEGSVCFISELLVEIVVDLVVVLAIAED
jgi:hypothetical protein